MIHLVSIAKSFAREGRPLNVVLRPGTMSLPADRRVAVLAPRRHGKTVLLQLLARHMAPDQGKIISTRSMSPVVNAESLFHRQLTGLENIRFIARTYEIDADFLTSAVNSLYGLDESIMRAMKDLDAPHRKSLEAAVTMMLPFGCYLFDEVGLLEPALLKGCMDVAFGRNSGFFFASSNRRFALQYAEAVVIIAEGGLYLFHDVEKGVEAFDRMKQG